MLQRVSVRLEFVYTHVPNQLYIAGSCRHKYETNIARVRAEWTCSIIVYTVCAHRHNSSY